MRELICEYLASLSVNVPVCCPAQVVRSCLRRVETSDTDSLRVCGSITGINGEADAVAMSGGEGDEQTSDDEERQGEAEVFVIALVIAVWIAEDEVEEDEDEEEENEEMGGIVLDAVTRLVPGKSEGSSELPGVKGAEDVVFLVKDSDKDEDEEDEDEDEDDEVFPIRWTAEDSLRSSFVTLPCPSRFSGSSRS